MKPHLFRIPDWTVGFILCDEYVELGLSEVELEGRRRVQKCHNTARSVFGGVEKR